MVLGKIKSSIYYGVPRTISFALRVCLFNNNFSHNNARNISNDHRNQISFTSYTYWSHTLPVNTIHFENLALIKSLLKWVHNLQGNVCRIGSPLARKGFWKGYKLSKLVLRGEECSVFPLAGWLQLSCRRLDRKIRGNFPMAVQLLVLNRQYMKGILLCELCFYLPTMILKLFSNYSHPLKLNPHFRSQSTNFGKSQMEGTKTIN